MQRSAGAAGKRVPEDLQVVELLEEAEFNNNNNDEDGYDDEESMYIVDTHIDSNDGDGDAITEDTKPAKASLASKGGQAANPNKAKLRCTCTKTKCLKLYCECFSSGYECEADWCKCSDCYNDSKPAHREQRDAAIKKLMKKKGKIAFRNASLEKKQAIAVAEGCNCKKSRCIKKYCECYSAGLVCRSNCRCEDCGNDGDVPPPPIKRKRKSRAKKHLAAYKAAGGAAAATNKASGKKTKGKKKRKRTRRN